MEVDVVVERQYSAKTIVPEDGDGVSEDQHDDNDGQCKDGLACSSGQHVEDVRGEATEHGHVAEVDEPLDGDDDHKDNKGKYCQYHTAIALKIVHRKITRLFHGNFKFVFSCF